MVKTTGSRECRQAIALGVLVTFGLCAPNLAWANPATLESALERYRADDLETARALLEQALSEGGNDPETLGRIYLHLGIVRAVSDPRAAQAAFAALLSLEASPTLPAVSPESVAAFERAHRARGGAPMLAMEIVAQDPTEVGTPHVASVRVRGDTARLTRGTRALVVGGPAGGMSVDARGESPFELRFPREATGEVGDLRYRIDLLDEHGSVLARDGTDADPRVVRIVAREAPSAPTGAGPSDDGGGGLLASPWFWGGAAAVVVAGTVVLAVAISSSSDVGHVGVPEFQER